MEGDAEHLGVAAQVLVVAQDEGNLDVQLAPALAPQQVQKAVVVAADQDRHALGLAGVAQAPVHPEGFGHGRREGALEGFAGEVQAAEVEFHAHEEAAARGIGAVLVAVQDVRAVVVQELRDGRHNALAVGAGDGQRGGALGIEGQGGGSRGRHIAREYRPAPPARVRMGV